MSVRALLGACALGVWVIAAPVVAQPLAALGQLEPGMWQLRAPGEAPRNICVSDPAALVQLQHARNTCRRLVVTNDKTVSTVQYSCPGAGWGRTTVRVSTPRAASIDTQGIADNAPFAYVAEARRTGDCGGGPSGSQSASLTQR